MRRFVPVIFAFVLLLVMLPEASGQQSICAPDESPTLVALDDVVFAAAPAAGGSLPPIAVLANDLIPTGTAVIITATQGAKGTVTVNGTSLVYRPNSALEDDSFTYRIEAGLSFSVATVYIKKRVTLTITGSCSGIGCLFDAVAPNPNAVRTYWWTFDDGSPGGGPSARAYREFTVERKYTITATATYYSGETAEGTYILDFHLARRMNWPITINGLSALTEIAYADLQTFPEGASGLLARIWWSDYSCETAEVNRCASSPEPHNVTIWNTLAHDHDQAGCDGISCVRAKLAVGYAHAGVYKVRLQLIRAAEPFNTPLYEYTKYVTIPNNPPQPRFTATLKTGRTFEFSIPPRTNVPKWDVDEVPRDWYITSLRPKPYEWDFGDGTVTTDDGLGTAGPALVSHTYAKAGKYVVKLKVTDADGNGVVASNEITVPNASPVAKIIFRCQGTTCTFDGRSSTDDGKVVEWLWDYGDGTPPAALDYNDMKPFGVSGCYSVALTVTDDDGATATARQTVVVSTVPSLAVGKTATDVKAVSYTFRAPDGSYQTKSTNGNLNGILEPGETAVIEPSWATPAKAEIWSVSMTNRQPAATSGGFTAKFYNDWVTYWRQGGYANCWAVGACHVLELKQVGPRAKHVDLVWNEQKPDLTETQVRAHVGSSFVDVPPSVWYYGFVESVNHAGLTDGCSADGFCPADPFTRDQIATWLLRAKYGAAYVPPKCTADPFTDVPCLGSTPHWAVDWIAQLKAEDLTSGTGEGAYSPANAVTRAEIAKFLISTKYGAGYVPPACAQDYSDVPCTSNPATSYWAAAYISDLKRRIFSFACDTSNNFCPGSTVTRAAAAVFFTATFDLGIDRRYCDGKPVYTSAVAQADEK